MLIPKLCLSQFVILMIIQHITIPVDGEEGHQRSGDHPPIHYTGGAKVKSGSCVFVYRIEGNFGKSLDKMHLAE